MRGTGDRKNWGVLIVLLVVTTCAALLVQGCGEVSPARRLSRMGISKNPEGLADAISAGNAEAVDCFMSLGTDPNTRFADDMTPLGLAATCGYLNIVEILLDSGAEIDAISGEIGGTALFWALCGGHGDIVRALLQLGADARVPVTDGTTPLHVAAQVGCSEAVTALIEFGADLNAENDDGATPLHLAVPLGTGETVRLLLEAGAKGDITFPGSGLQPPMSALFCAVEFGRADVVPVLVEHGFDPNERQGTWRGDTPLMLAAAKGDLAVVQALLENGADINREGYAGLENPLTNAACGGHLDVLRYLIEHGADLNAKTAMSTDIRCLLCLAAIAGHEPIIEALVEAGLDVNHPIDTNWTDATADGMCYWTPLMQAAAAGNRSTVSTLLQLGADPATKDGKGRTAADAASEMGFYDIRNLLEK